MPPEKTEKTYKYVGVLGLIPASVAVRELRTLDFWRHVLCEYIVTFIYLFTLTGMGSPYVVDSTGHASNLRAALTVGLIICVLVESFAHVSGAHFNPIVTLMFVLTERTSFIKGIFYVAVHCLGSISGVALMQELTPGDVRDAYRPLSVNDDLPTWKGMLIELVLTFNFIIISIGVIDSDRKRVRFAGFPIGMTVACGILAAGYSTGGSMNPIVIFGPAVVTNKWEDHWAYWVGPIIGSTLACIVYHLLVCERIPVEDTHLQHHHHRNSNTACNTDINNNNNNYKDINNNNNNCGLSLRTVTAHNTQPNGSIDYTASYTTAM